MDLAVYNLGGQLVRRLVRERQPAGRYAMVWDGRDESGSAVSSGVYFYRLVAGDFAETRRMMLVK